MNESILTKMRKLNQQYAYTSIHLHETIARKAGFSGTDHKYLGFLLQKDRLTAGELARLSGLTTGAVTGLIDRFEKKNLVRRETTKDDRRKVYIVPDQAGIMALLEPLYREYRAESQKLIASFSEDEIAVIESFYTKSLAMMNTVIDNLNEKPAL